MTAAPQSIQPKISETRQHTPTPWEVECEGQSIISRNVPKGRMLVADIRGWGYLTGKGQGALGLSYEEAVAIQTANAAFIVEAVNSHARLTERCEQYKGQVKAGSDEIDALKARVMELEIKGNALASQLGAVIDRLGQGQAYSSTLSVLNGFRAALSPDGKNGVGK